MLDVLQPVYAEKPEIGFYVMSGLRIMDGPFTSQQEAEDHLSTMIGEWASPELLAQYLARFDGTVLDLVKDECGEVINGHYLKGFRGLRIEP